MMYKLPRQLHSGETSSLPQEWEILGMTDHTNDIQLKELIVGSFFDTNNVTPNWIWGQNNYGNYDAESGKFTGTIGMVRKLLSNAFYFSITFFYSH